MNFLFWNINKKDLTNEIVDLVEAYQIDVLVLIESQLSNDNLLTLLKHKNNLFHYSPRLVYDDKEIAFFTKIDKKYVKDTEDEPRYFGKQIERNDQKLNIIVTHYPSKANYDEEDQIAAIPEFSAFIEFIENKYQNNNTIVFGDFNMNPFEKAMVQNTGMHSTMDKNTALKENRIVNAKKYKYFYNPMWSFYGELGKGETNGTYYYQSSKPVVHNWNIFDQVLLRPSLIPYFDDNEIEIITKINGKSLLNKNGFIDDKNFSDHLPVKFTLKI